MLNDEFLFFDGLFDQLYEKKRITEKFNPEVEARFLKDNINY